MKVKHTANKIHADRMQQMAINGTGYLRMLAQVNKFLKSWTDKVLTGGTLWFVRGPARHEIVSIRVAARARQEKYIHNEDGSGR